MRVLWLTPTNELIDNKNTNVGYNGCGWIGALRKVIEDYSICELGVTFVSHVYKEEQLFNRTIYYPIYIPKETSIGKFRKYYGKYKDSDINQFVKELKCIIEKFKPDIIHIFGLENPLSTIIGKTHVPVVVHLQGLFGPYNNAFFPVGVNKSSFLFPITFREWILRNGFVFAKKSFSIRAKNENILFKNLTYLMGRTQWDFQVSQLLAPTSIYYHVDEVLRPVFYDNKGKWTVKKRTKFTIISTISETVYKGLDLIIKTAKLLKEITDIDFEWQVVGIVETSKMIRFFEKQTQMKSAHVNINYIGILTAKELCEFELNADVYVHPSYIDNSPNSICEAQLLGMPVISTNVGGVLTLIENNVSGILVPANAPYELCYYLQLIQKNTDLSIRLSKNAALMAYQRHNPDKILMEVMGCYENVINHAQIK